MNDLPKVTVSYKTSLSPKDIDLSLLKISTLMNRRLNS